MGLRSLKRRFLESIGNFASEFSKKYNLESQLQYVHWYSTSILRPETRLTY
jgi:hypothetical protein